MTHTGTQIRPWALVPVKRFMEAKRRLGSVFSPDERAAVAEAMLHDVLTVLSRSAELAGILVVTSDSGAAALARDYGADVAPDTLEQNTNAAVIQGLDRLNAERREGVVVVPGDVPFLTIAEIKRVVETLNTTPLVLVPAARDDGTNLLAGALPLPIQPAFGSGSFHRHLAAASAAHVRPAILTMRGLGHDIDVPADLIAPFIGAPHTRAAIKRLTRETPARRPFLPIEEPLTT